MIEKFKEDKEILNIYRYGSRVYGRVTEQSDHDYIVVVKDESILERELVDTEGNNYNIYKLSEWEDMVKRNHIVVLECSFLGNEHIIKEKEKFEIEIDLVELRKSISSVVSNAYVKCRKKLVVGEDFNPYIAKKSLWHGIRILMYGIQCAKYGRILDYEVANKYYDDIVLSESNNWEHYKDKWQPIYKNLKSEFKKFTEDSWKEYKEGLYGKLITTKYI